MKSLRAIPASSWAGGRRSETHGYSQPQRGGSGMGPRRLTELFQGLGNDLLETFLSLVPSPHSPSNLQASISALQAS